MAFIKTNSEAVNRVLSQSEAAEAEIRRAEAAFEQMSKSQAAAFDQSDKLPELVIDKNVQKNPLPLYGFYGEQFFAARPSAELLAKEQARCFNNKEREDPIEILEAGLCKKFGVIPPRKWPNRRRDRGETGEQLMMIGQTVNDRRNPKIWGLRSEDFTRHCHIGGPSGSGKSTLLNSMCVQQLWYWRGGLLMEPHGDLALSVLRTAPPYRIHDTLYLNVLDATHSPGFNPLELPPNATDDMRQEAVGAVTSLIAKHFNMESGMVKLMKMLTNALNALSYVPGATLLEVMDFYNNEDIRNTVLSFVPDGPQKEAMEELAASAKSDDTGSLDNRISRFTTNRYMRHLFGQSHTTISFYDLMNQGYFIICPVSKGGTSDDTFLKFYGSYIVSEVYKAALLRDSIDEPERVNFAMVLDEFQNFISDDIEGILAEARKYGLQLILANQILAQLQPQSMRAAVLQNCATKLYYAQQVEDAPVIAKTLGHGLKAEDLMSVPKYHVMAAPLIKGAYARPFISAVFPPLSPHPEMSGIVAEVIAENTRNKYMKSRDEIDAEINDRKERLASGNKQAVIELVTQKNR